MAKLDDFSKIYHNDKSLKCVYNNNKMIYNNVFYFEMEYDIGNSMAFWRSVEYPTGRYKITIYTGGRKPANIPKMFGVTTTMIKDTIYTITLDTSKITDDRMQVFYTDVPPSPIKVTYERV